jgi:hypothetical protein
VKDFDDKFKNCLDGLVLENIKSEDYLRVFNFYLSHDLNYEELKKKFI